MESFKVEGGKKILNLFSKNNIMLECQPSSTVLTIEMGELFATLTKISLSQKHLRE